MNSTWIMNNDSVMLYDGPLDGGGVGLGTDGENSFDLEIGAATGDAIGRMELHDNALLRISDDLKIGAEDNGNGQFLMDGNSVATIGSGISVGERESGKGLLQVAGNALLVSGNSADPGDQELGRTNEGYLTMTRGDVAISDAAKVYVRTLQHRGGVANLTIENSGQLHIFDVFKNEAPDLGTATVLGAASGPQRTSHIAGESGGEFNLTIKDDAVMTVDSDLEDSSWAGLAVSGGTNRGANASGGLSVIEVRDRGSLTVQQDLHLTLGEGEDASSTLRIVGSETSVAVNGDLYFALSPEGDDNLGDATLHSVITSNSHSTVAVGGNANIGNGLLKVELDGYSPRGGETFTLVEAGAIEGDQFIEADFSAAELPDGLAWELEISDTAIMLSIAGMLEGILGDFDGQNGLDLADIDTLVTQIQAASSDLAFDVNADNSLNADDINVWLSLKSDADGKSYLPGDADLNGNVDFADFLQLSASFGAADTTWSQGNYDAQNGTDFSDFLVLSANFGSTSDAQSVPEPSGISSLLLTLLASLAVGRHVRSGAGKALSYSS